MFKTAEALRNYILGGHGEVILESPSGKHIVYQFEQSKKDPKCLFASAKIDGKFMYIAYIVECKSQNPRFPRWRSAVITKNSAVHADSDEYKGVDYIMHMAYNDAIIERSPMKVMHNGICAVCGSKLTSPKSIEEGIGPDCKKRLLGR